MKKLFLISFAALLSAGPINAQEKQDQGLDLVGNSILWQSFRAGMDEKAIKQAIKQDSLTANIRQDPLIGRQGPFFWKEKSYYHVGIISIMNSDFRLSFQMSRGDNSAKLTTVSLSSDGSKYDTPSRDNCLAEKISLFRKIVSSMKEKYEEIKFSDNYAVFRNEGAHISVSIDQALLVRPSLDSRALSSDASYQLFKIRSAEHDYQQALCRLSDVEASSGGLEAYASLFSGGEYAGVVNIYYTDGMALQNRGNLIRLEREAQEREKREIEEASKANL
ncbi:hypothetical protein MCEREM21A_02333 [Sphingomonadaceae bacterium]